MSFLVDHLGTLIVGILLLAAVAAIVVYMAKKRKKGSSCGCDCPGCPSGGACGRDASGKT